MKTFVLMVLLCAIGSATAFAQLKVFNDGSVGVGNNGFNDHKFVVSGDRIVLAGSRSGYNSSSTWGRGVIGSSEVSTWRGDIGVVGCAENSAPASSGRAIGVQGLAGNATPGYNYAVLGALKGTNGGAAIFGTSNAADYFGIPVGGRYAGYFVGNVNVTGLINGITVGNSDLRYKQNVLSLSELKLKALSRVMEMNPIEYNLRQIYTASVGDSAKVVYGMYDEKSQLFQKKHYGLIAQELQKLYPDLVYEDDNGYLSVNYIGIIPLLIQSIKELKNEVDALTAVSPIKQQSSQVAKSNQTGLSADTEQLSASLQQNSPNPFSQSTEIRYYLPEQIGTALLCIYDMSGKQLKQIVLSQRGEGAATIHGSEFSAGIYLYALIADGKEVDVKRMILTE